MCESWGERHLFSPCADLPSSSLGARTIDSSTIFDSGSGFFDNVGPEVGVVAEIDGTQTRILLVDSFTLTSTGRLRLVGDHPILIASIGDVKIDGFVSVASRWVPPRSIEGEFEEGAGANHSSCPPSDEDNNGGLEGVSNDGGGGGGGGGGFGNDGGDGGDGQDGDQDGGDKGTKVSEPTIRGGCPGGRGGEGDDMPNTSEHDGGRAGSSGGGLVISSITSITINGVIHAGGAGGRGQLVRHRHGGGGGGSGGLIELEAEGLIVSDGAVLAANGGAGGGGSNDVLDDDAVLNGRDSTLDAEPALGGTGDGSGSGGFGGSLNLGQDSDGHTGDRGGGGGGGSVGYIMFVDFGQGLSDISGSALISPAFTSIIAQPGALAKQQAEQQLPLGKSAACR